jgi:hypothetical protein
MGHQSIGDEDCALVQLGRVRDWASCCSSGFGGRWYWRQEVLEEYRRSEQHGARRDGGKPRQHEEQNSRALLCVPPCHRGLSRLTELKQTAPMKIDNPTAIHEEHRIGHSVVGELLLGLKTRKDRSDAIN